MKFNEKAIFIKTRRSRIKKKLEKNNKNSKVKLILFIFIIIFFCLILTYAIKMIFHKTNKDNNENDNNLYNIQINPQKTEEKPKIIAITYGNMFFKNQLKLNNKSAIEVGEVDEHYEYGPHVLDHEFKEKNKNILSRGRGNGLWLWKPYIINKTIVEKLRDGDYLIYTDAAMLFMNSSRLLINFLEEHNASMWMNRLTLKERKFSKRDAFILMGVDTPYYYDTNQYMAGIQIYKKSNYTVKFIQEWLNYCQDERIITGIKNTLGKDNYPGFIENRHDQTALSLLIKKYGEANAGNPNMTLDELKQRKSIIMPNIICMYRRKPFKDYDDIKEKCKKTIEYQNHIFS